MRTAASAFCAACLFTASSLSFAQEGEAFDINEITCRDLLLAPSEEEPNILIYFHGYVSGLREDASIDVDTFGAISEQVVEACVDDSAAKLLDVFMAKR